MDLATLTGVVATHAALRRRQRMQPAGGDGDKVFPPTYPGDGRNSPPVHVIEQRRINGSDVPCALVDSVQSQANRMEEALSAAIEDGAVQIPHLVVDFSGSDLAGVTAITSLGAPHRVYDAILRDSLLDGTPFPASALGRSLAQARPSDATALLQASPTALVFGAWNSTGEGGGIGAKFSRALVSEIVAIGATGGKRTSSRIDPLGVLRKVTVYQGQGKTWGVDKAKAGKGAKEVRPSEINHGNILPSVSALGITCDYIEHTTVVSFAGLRRLGFGAGERAAAGRAYLAALALLGIVEQDAWGYALRSRCDLVCDGAAPFELVAADGRTESVELGREAARKLYRAAFEAARKAGFKLSAEAVRLRPQEKLVAIVKRSQEMALAGEGGEAEDV